MPFIAVVKNIKKAADSYLFKGKTQCAALVQQTTSAPGTSLWRKGVKVKDATAGDIAEGTAIATFNADNRYPSTDPPGRHAAIYLSHDKTGIKVIDQWVGKSAPAERVIRYKGESTDGWQNNGDYYYVIEIE